MKALILNEPGSIKNLQYADIEKPTIKDNEVLVKTISISVNPVDYKARENDNTLSWLFGSQRPIILGWDLSGKIESIGKEVKDFKVGDEVFGMANFPGKGNAYAEYIAVPQDHLTLKPKNISHQESAVATLAALTAWQSLVTKGKIKKGDRILIHGASGGVGHFATQIAKYFGAYVIGTSSEKNKNFVLQNGVDKHIDYTKVNFEDEVSEVDLVFNTISDDINRRSIEITKSGGKIVYILGQVSQVNIDRAKGKNINLFSNVVESSGTDMKKIADLLEKKIIKSHISHTFSFNEIPEAHSHLETGRTVGKIVINI